MAENNIKNVEKTDGMTILEVAGEVTHARSPGFRDALFGFVSEKPNKLILDLTGVDYMDSSGVAILVQVLKTLRDAGGQLVLCSMNERVHAIFEISRLVSVFKIVESLAAAKTA